MDVIADSIISFCQCGNAFYLNEDQCSLCEQEFDETFRKKWHEYTPLTQMLVIDIDGTSTEDLYSKEPDLDGATCNKCQLYSTMACQAISDLFIDEELYGPEEGGISPCWAYNPES